MPVPSLPDPKIFLLLGRRKPIFPQKECLSFPSSHWPHRVPISSSNLPSTLPVAPQESMLLWLVTQLWALVSVGRGSTASAHE